MLRWNAGARRGRAFTAALACALVWLGIAAAGSSAATYFVDAARPDDAGSGTSWDDAKRTIDAAIAASAAGDAILVKYGAYAIDDDIVLVSHRRITSDDGTHLDWSSADPDSSLCVVDAGQGSRVLTIHGAAMTGPTHVRGLELTGGDGTYSSADPSAAYGGGVYVDGGADVTLERCWISGNVGGTSYNGFGGGVACLGTGTDVSIEDCRISGNTAATPHHGYGGGIYCDGVTATIVGNVIEGNLGSVHRTGVGGGIYAANSDVVVQSNTITDNVAAGPSSGAGGNGGGVYLFSGTADVGLNTITGNSAAEATSRSGAGGGIYCSTAETYIWENVVGENVASRGGRGNGGGIYCRGSDSVVRDNEVYDNVASTSTTGGYYAYGAGGGIVAGEGSGIHVLRNRVYGNVASRYGTGNGGGIWINNIAQIVERNLIYDNVASEGAPGAGGGVFINGTTRAEVVNNTLYHNASQTGGDGGTGSGIYHTSGGTPTIRNNAIAAHDVPGSDMVGIYETSALTVEYNCYHDNPGGHYNEHVVSLNEGIGEPRFTDAAVRDFELLYDSPLIEAGHPDTEVPENGGWRVDVGAIEYTGIRHARAVPGPGEYLFGGQVRAKVTVTTLGTLSEIDMTVHPGERHPDAVSVVDRWFDIQADEGGGTTFELTLSYLDEELNGHRESDLTLWRRDGSSWEGPKVPTDADADDDWLTVSGETAFSDWVISGFDVMLDVPGETVLGPAVALGAPAPNPFRVVSRLRFDLADRGRTTLAVYRTDGRRVRTLIDAVLPVGVHEITWDGRDDAGHAVASGTYFCRLSTARGRVDRRLTLVR